MNKLSHSSASRFQTCPTSYFYHYVKRYRPNTQSAALLFGTAVDRGIMELLKDPSGSQAEKAFEYAWRFQEINSHNTYLPTCQKIVYANSDYDEELLQAEDIEKLKEKYDVPDPLYAVKMVYERKELLGFDGLLELDKVLLNHANWLSLHRKGLVMLESVRTKVLPNIEEVLGTQVYVSLENDDGDKIVGYADLVCRWKGYSKPVVIDFKTSSRDYPKDAVLTSPQLTLYVHSLAEKYEDTRLAGFIVLGKHLRKNRKKTCSICSNDGTGKRHKTCDAEIIGKRCGGAWNETVAPEALVDVLINEIPERTEDIVLENLAQINLMINQGIFVRNFNSCLKPWGPCEFLGLCYKDSKEGLIDLNEQGEKKE